MNKSLNMAFAALRANNFITSEGRGSCAGMTASILRDALEGTSARGFVFYTSQDEKAYLAGVPLRIYFGCNGKPKEYTRKLVCGYLAGAGFEVENG